MDVVEILALIALLLAVASFWPPLEPLSRIAVILLAIALFLIGHA